jgi:tetratricopeptide (TPR) repeat protein
MRAYVFTDPALARHAGRFVWLELDNEKAKNASVSKRLDVRALPTYFILDPVTEGVALRWVGGATVAQLDRILDDGRLAVKRAAQERSGSAARTEAPGSGAAKADHAREKAERLYGAGDNAAAAAAYGEALAAAPAGWAHYAPTVESRLFALSSCDSSEAGALLARDAYPRLKRTPSAANVAASGLDAALALPAEHPQRAELVKALTAAAHEVVADSTLGVAADDRSGTYIALLGERKDAKDDAGAREVARQWAAFLEAQAARAKTPEQRAVFDSHRLAAYMEMGEPARAIPMLEASERDFPADYNPPARLAIAYQELKRWDEALAASDRALAKAYGPRKIRLLRTRADVYAAKGDTTAARRTVEEAITTAESFPPGQRSDATIGGLKKKLAALK